MASRNDVERWREWLRPYRGAEMYDGPTDAEAARIARDAVPAMADMLERAMPYVHYVACDPRAGTMRLDAQALWRAWRGEVDDADEG